jgi:transposase-like protein
VCPSCERAANWYRIKAERAYSCQWCGHHLHPTVGTPFEQTRTPLQLWLYAIHLFTTTRNGVAAKELERQLGVTYKTAWRMAGLIREHMANVDGMESFWSQLKRMINGTHIHVSGKHLWKYAKEAEFRFNLRHTPAAMFPALISTFPPLN